MNPRKHKPELLNFTTKALAHFKHMVSMQGKENKVKLGVKKMGCNALVGVGQGSVRGTYLVTIEWKGKKSNSKPLAFVGKGVCFDLSLIHISEPTRPY